jgi:NAD(P)H-dependent FMN reductase
MISIIAGTNRPDNNSVIVAKACLDYFLKRGIEAQILSLSSLPENFVFSEMYQPHSSHYKLIVDQYISSAEKFLFIIPEYNGGFPGILKAFIDSLDYLTLKGKKSGLIGVASGHAGALRPLDHFTDVLHHLKVEVFSNKPKLSNVESLISNHSLTDKESLKKISEFIDELILF